MTEKIKEIKNNTSKQQDYELVKLGTGGLKKMTLQRAIKLLECEYEKAKNNPVIFNPLAYALYQVWKIADVKGDKK